MPELLRAQAAALRAQADVLDTLASNLGALDDEMLDLAKAKAWFGVGRDALLGAADRGELALVRGPRNKLLVRRSALEAWRASRPYVPRGAAKLLIAEWERSVRKPK